MLKNDLDTVAGRCNSYKWNDLKYPDTIALDIADMDYRLSDDLLSRFTERISTGNFGYEFEGDSYYDALIEWMLRRHDLRLSRDWIITCHGTIFAFKVILSAFSKESDGVLLASPVYNSYFTAIEINNRVKVFSPLIEDEGRYRLDYEDFEKKIKEQNIKIFVLCNPHNPVGKVWTRQELNKMIEICKRHSVLIVSDEVHQDFVYDNVSFVSCIEFKDIYDKIIVLTSPCKTFNAAGLQLANVLICDKTVRERFWLEKTRRGYMAGNSMSIYMCEILYRYGDRWHDESFRYIRKNLSLLKALFEAYPEIKVAKSDSLFLLWVDMRGLGLSDEELEKMITDEMHLKVGIGTRYGEGGSGFIRINAATSELLIKQTINRMKQVLDKHIKGDQNDQTQ